MERIGILEMNAMSDFINRPVASPPPTNIKIIKKRANDFLRAKSENRFAFMIILSNDFELIPEGFTGVYMRDEECQIVPDALVNVIKERSIGGFDHAPEDHVLHLFVNRWHPDGYQVNMAIIDLVMGWLDKNL